MRWLLVAGLLLSACSGNTDGGGGAAVPPPPEGGASGKMALSQAGSSVSGGAAPVIGGTSAGAIASAGSEPTAGMTQGGGAQGGSESGGSSGAATSGSGGVAAAGTASDGGAPATSGGAGETQSGGDGGTPSDPDPCEGVKHWSPTDKITDYTPRPADAPGDWRGDLRVFGQILWAAQQADGCQTYPGHDAPGDPAGDGWIEVATCAGGPITETAPCQCAAGACCDGCYLRSASHFCGETVRAVRCSGNSSEGDYWNLFCDGVTVDKCTRWAVHTKYTSGVCATAVMCVNETDETPCYP